MALSSRREEDTMDIENADGDPIDVLHDEEALQRVVEETESEEEAMVDEPPRSSPSLMCSAFVANSALPASPLTIRRQVSASPHISESDVELVDYDSRFMPSAVQSHYENDCSERVIPESQADNSVDDRHHNKKRRTRSESTTSDLPTFKAPTGSIFEPEGPYTQQLLFRDSSIPDVDSVSEPERPQPQDLMFRNQSSIPEYESESLDGDVPAQRSSQNTHKFTNNHINAMDPNDIAMDPDDDAIRASPPHSSFNANGQNDTKTNEAQDDIAEEYIVESIIEHYYDAGTKYYLVKWEGYENSQDWLAEEDLAGAAEVVAEYNRRFARREEKMKAR